jgi:hypothetical protein
MSATDKMHGLIDGIAELEEKLKNAKEQERHWRGIVTNLTNDLNRIKKEARELSSTLFKE